MNSLFLKCVLITTLLQPLFLFGAAKLGSAACTICNTFVINSKKDTHYKSSEHQTNIYYEELYLDYEELYDHFMVLGANYVELKTKQGPPKRKRASDSDSSDNDQPPRKKTQKNHQSSKCPTCSQPMPKNVIAKHLKASHDPSKIFPFKCSACSECEVTTSFDREDRLSRHIKNTHGS